MSDDANPQDPENWLSLSDDDLSYDSTSDDDSYDSEYVLQDLRDMLREYEAQNPQG